MTPSKHVQRKARRLLDEDRVTISHIDPNTGAVDGTVRGDHGAYQTLVTTRGTFSCTCAWGGHSSVGSVHRCAHAEAMKIAAGF